MELPQIIRRHEDEGEGGQTATGFDGKRLGNDPTAEIDAINIHRDRKRFLIHWNEGVLAEQWYILGKISSSYFV